MSLRESGNGKKINKYEGKKLGRRGKARMHISSAATMLCYIFLVLF